jgi:hypothetical protein
VPQRPLPLGPRDEAGPAQQSDNLFERKGGTILTVAAQCSNVRLCARIATDIMCARRIPLAATPSRSIKPGRETR